MSFFDKVKHFAGGHGVKATITEIENQPPEGAKFPVSETMLRFEVEVTGDKEVTVLAHVFSVWAERKSEQNPRLIEVADERHDEKTDHSGANVKWPYELKPGRIVRDNCYITNVDFQKALKEMDVNDVRAAINDPSYEFFVKFTADVKGSPMDAQVRQTIRVIR